MSSAAPGACPGTVLQPPSKSSLQPSMPVVLQQVPVQTAVVAPLLMLSQLAAHEEQLLAGMAPHVSVQQPQVGESLPQIAGHLISASILSIQGCKVTKNLRRALKKL